MNVILPYFQEPKDPGLASEKLIYNAFTLSSDWQAELTRPQCSVKRVCAQTQRNDQLLPKQFLKI